MPPGCLLKEDFHVHLVGTPGLSRETMTTSESSQNHWLNLVLSLNVWWDHSSHLSVIHEEMFPLGDDLKTVKTADSVIWWLCCELQLVHFKVSFI